MKSSKTYYGLRQRLQRLALLLFSLFLLGGNTFGLAQDNNADLNSEASFYAFLSDKNLEPSGPVYGYLKDKPFFQAFMKDGQIGENKFRPVLQWRHWADKRQPFFASLVFCFFVSLLLWSLAPGKLKAAESSAKTEFWPSFGFGLLATGLIVFSARTFFLTHIGWPLGIVTMAGFQLSLLIGLAIAVSLLGHAVVVLIKVKDLGIFKNNPVCLRFWEYLIGALICALILQIPAPTGLPQPGTRILALMAILGFGALVRNWQKSRVLSK